MIDFTEYSNMLDQNISFSEIAHKCSKWLPPSLYRYRRTNTDYWEKELHGQLFLAKANIVNDPFDCLLYINFENISKNSKLFDRISSTYGINYNDFMKIIKTEDMGNRILKPFQEDINILSFSECKNSHLMWSHYSDQHKGICIEYDTALFKDTIKAILFPVVYSNIRPDITKKLENLQENALLKVFVSKNTEWHYEKEWRLINNRPDNEFYNRKAIIDCCRLLPGLLS